ncbi:unnamed protein product [Adineta steineri]|uniref:HAT C-terminal dimerisation domain-containing protein n=1 Tax=Adineta steineri TaxID=433720 RepID=A0A814AVZ1_9BILA|nr:unnamed protein product [Adineta steineri]CAF0920664.1 unnamed protein product [Adineta steineri]
MRLNQVQQHYTDSCSWFHNSPARKEDSIKNIDELNEELSDLYHTVLLSFLTLEYIGNKQGSKLLLIDPKLAEKQLNDKQMRMGRFISDLLSLNEVNRLTDEWLMYSIETTDDSWIIKRKYIDVEYHKINYYWNKALSIVRSSGYPKYLTLYKLIRNILIISHGNADVERGFSINQNILTEDCTLLSEKSINGLRTTYNVVKFLGFDSIHKMPTNIDMLRAVQKSTAL